MSVSLLTIATIVFGISMGPRPFPLPSANVDPGDCAEPDLARQLFRTAFLDIKTGRFGAARAELRRILAIYPDRPFARTARLAIADSFYIEGGSRNIDRAETLYHEFLQSFPGDEMLDSVSLAIARVHLRQASWRSGEGGSAKLAERELKELLLRHPENVLRDQAQACLDRVQEIPRIA